MVCASVQTAVCGVCQLAAVMCTAATTNPLHPGALHCLLPYLLPSHSQELVSTLCCVLESVIEIDAIGTFRLAPPADRGPDHSPHGSHSKRTDQEVGGGGGWLAMCGSGGPDSSGWHHTTHAALSGCSVNTLTFTSDWKLSGWLWKC